MSQPLYTIVIFSLYMNLALLSCNSKLYRIDIMHNNLKHLVPVLISASLLLILSFGYRSGFGLFLQPLSESRDWALGISTAWAIPDCPFNAGTH